MMIRQQRLRGPAHRPTCDKLLRHRRSNKRTSASHTTLNHPHTLISLRPTSLLNPLCAMLAGGCAATQQRLRGPAHRGHHPGPSDTAVATTHLTLHPHALRPVPPPTPAHTTPTSVHKGRGLAAASLRSKHRWTTACRVQTHYGYWIEGC